MSNNSLKVGADDLSRQIKDWIACPTCDTLYLSQEVDFDHKAVCSVCHTVLLEPKRHAGMHIIMLSLTVIILVASALFFPFLAVSAAGLSNETNLSDIILSFNGSALMPLAVIVGAMIILMPLLRMALNIYVLLPLVFDAKPLPYSAFAFRWSEQLRPWTMAEIFVLGVAVALVKVAGMAQIGFGVAFWMFTALVVISLLNDSFLCRYSVWRAIERNSP